MESDDKRLKALFNNEPSRDIPGEEDEPGYKGAKPQLAVTFIDGTGTPYQFAYSHLYRIETSGSSLVVEFSDHRVIVEGRKLFSPAKDCLMRRIGQHKVEFVEVHPRPEFIDGAVVLAIRVEPKR